MSVAGGKLTRALTALEKVSMRNGRSDGTGGPRESGGRFGLLRAVAAAPAMLGSVGLVVVATGGLGAWALPALLIWVGCGAVALTRGGERIAVRVAFGFRRPSPAQAAVLQPLCAAALTSAGTRADDVELYVQRNRQLNAYATGGRSVAVTSRVLDEHRAGRLSDGQVVAVLVHELGHHASRATRPMLIAMWLAAPWRVAARLLASLTSGLSRCQPGWALAVVCVCGVVVAVVRAVHEGRWLAGGVIAAIALIAVVCPLVDAWACRRAEFAADRFAADHGRADELAAALRALHGRSSTVSGLSGRLLATHPTADERITALGRVATGWHAAVLRSRRLVRASRRSLELSPAE
ncbi:membrane protein of unknown function; Putative peptidase domain [Modestobacter italicus]|uniref:Peptidase M48 domain-containing protein n=2 Tax=Modestobacter italicus (strain DSM 44449 / CECT 9708 / BC 501) TaxID=2732864 RepID=I4EYP6_MODI5|nr:membrane protein of unknown function; Putative peptidase domain [Modestobacter marinus]